MLFFFQNEAFKTTEKLCLGESIDLTGIEINT